MIRSFDISRVLLLYGVWHYTRAPYNLFSIWMDVLRFVLHFFSVRLLLRTFFAPFHRLQERAPSGLAHVGDMIAAQTVNLIMRCVGMTMRACILVVGCCAYIVTFFLGAFFLFAWLFLPLGVGVFVVIGLSYFFGLVPA